MTQLNVNPIPGARLKERVRHRLSNNPLNNILAAVADRVGGSRAREVERFLRFALVGISGAIIDLGLVYVLQMTILPPNPAASFDYNVALVSFIAFTTAVLNNFFWTRYWVYPDSRTRSLRRQLALFTFISFVGGGFRIVWVTITHNFLGHALMPLALPFIHIVRPGYVPGIVAEEKLGTMIATLIAMIIVMFWNFFANRYWTYNDVK